MLPKPGPAEGLGVKRARRDARLVAAFEGLQPFAVLGLGRHLGCLRRPAGAVMTCCDPPSPSPARAPSVLCMAPRCAARSPGVPLSVLCRRLPQVSLRPAALRGVCRPSSASQFRRRFWRTKFVNGQRRQRAAAPTTRRKQGERPPSTTPARTPHPHRTAGLRGQGRATREAPADARDNKDGE